MDTRPLGDTTERIRQRLEAKHLVREEGLALAREVIRLAAVAIRAVHRRDFSLAEAYLAQARAKLEQASHALAPHPDIYYAGFLQDAQKEYAEASCTLALIEGRPLPTPEELGLEDGPYLNGLGEAVGELRRYLLDCLREGDLNKGEEALTAMSDIYDALTTIDYPEAITGGLRRTTDNVRAILERTRGDFTLAYVQRRLEQKLQGQRP